MNDLLNIIKDIDLINLKFRSIRDKINPIKSIPKNLLERFDIDFEDYDFMYYLKGMDIHSSKTITSSDRIKILSHLVIIYHPILI